MHRLPSRPARTPRLLFVISVIAVFVLVPLIAGAAPSSPQLPAGPRALRASAGTTGTIAVLSWADAGGASGYRIWRAEAADGEYRPIGSAAAASFLDASGVPGRSYFYRVTSLFGDGVESVASTPAGPVEAAWNQSPHTTYAKGNLCLTCHALHREGAKDGDVATAELQVCESCHDGQGATTNVKDGPRDSFALASGHRLEGVAGKGDLTNTCSSCHSPHADPRKRHGLYKTKVNGKAVAGGNSWCLACHDDSARWTPSYPGTANPIRGQGGYPVLGTFPGASVYADPKKNAHASMNVAGGVKGDCLVCHAAHRGPNEYDGLVLTYRPPTASTVASDRAEGTSNQLCLACHAGQPLWQKQGAADIAGFVLPQADGAYLTHSIVTSGGTLPAGAPIPCYDCHNPHGSARGNSSMLSDDLGAGLSTKTAAGVRAFCLSCHCTSDGLVWDSTKQTYAPVGDELFEGLRRDGARGNALRLREAEGHAGASTSSCYECHGDSYAAGGANVHAPARPPIAPAAFRAVRDARTQERTATVQRLDVEPAPVRREASPTD